MNNILNNPIFKEIEKEYRRDFGIEIKKYLVKKEISNNEKFISDFINFFRLKDKPNQKDIVLIKLTPKQLEAGTLLSTIKETFFYGSGRSGKTTLIVLKIFFEALYNHAKVLCIIEYYPDIKDSLFKTFLDIIDKYSLNFSINHSPPIMFKFLSGVEITLKGIQDGTKCTSQDKKLGSEYSLIYFNEASQISYTTFSILKTRLNKPKVNNAKDLLSTQAIVDCNPTAKSHWFYRYFIDHTNSSSDNPLPDSLLSQIKAMMLNPVDNMDNIQNDYIERISYIGGNTYRRFVLGEFSSGD